MKKQYILTEGEYFRLCNKLEEINLTVHELRNKLEVTEIERYKEDFKSISIKVYELTRQLNWS